MTASRRRARLLRWPTPTCTRAARCRHDIDELSHSDADNYVVDMKSYGRAPTFLPRTGYEQVRSVVAALAGDWAAARKVELVLPETGVCSLNRTPEPAEAPPAVAACCSAGSAEPEDAVAA
jgi:hypothetical protein